MTITVKEKMMSTAKKKKMTSIVKQKMTSIVKQQMAWKRMQLIAVRLRMMSSS